MKLFFNQKIEKRKFNLYQKGGGTKRACDF
jgi:hypothetical protein